MRRMRKNPSVRWPVKPFELLAQTLSPDGSAIKLVRRDDEYIILADGAVLMSSRMHGSEEALATLACQRLRTSERPRVLIGGLGMGFTLRATLDVLPPESTVVVAELVPAVVEWNRGLLGPLAKHPLRDPRVQLENADVLVTLSASTDQFDAVLLDVDNGPGAFTSSGNLELYTQRGITAARTALKKRGMLSIWATQEDQKFVERLRHNGFEAHVHHLRARLKKGPRHIIFLARKS